MYRFISWNVNGIRAAQKKGLIDWLTKEQPDFLCLQETKADKDQLSKELLSVDGYQSYWCSAVRRGYSGVCVYAKTVPDNIVYGIGDQRFDSEGRTLVLEYADFILINTYFPNGGASAERLKFKLDFYKTYFKFIKKLKKKNKAIISCGDFNTAHNEIDLARPKENSKVSGFLPEERALLDEYITMGFIDTFRFLHKEKVAYSWWDYKTRARERDVGWRIDYFFISQNAEKTLKQAFILKQVQGSDHCPVGIELKI
jgi:exodeoxyribonuclease-3